MTERSKRHRRPRESYTAAQRAWCKQYQLETTFEPLMDDFEAGEESFNEAARRSIRWFEDWSRDALHRVSVKIPCDNTQKSA